MIFFESNEVQYIYKIGDNPFDIRMKQSYHDTDIQYKLKAVEIGEIKDLLDYQFNDNPFQYSLVAMPYSKSNENWMPDKERRFIVKNWLANVMPINISIVGAIFEGFLMNTTIDFNDMSITKLLKYKEPEEIEEILKFTKTLSLESINLHRKYCSEMGCDIERKHVIKIDFINSKLKETKSGVNKIDLDKIVWLGTQKEQAELWVMLKEMGWIENYKNDTIKVCFTNSHSIQQVLKPNKDLRTGRNHYDSIFTTNYETMFHGIEKNKKSPK